MRVHWVGLETRTGDEEGWVTRGLGSGEEKRHRKTCGLAACGRGGGRRVTERKEAALQEQEGEGWQRGWVSAEQAQKVC